jgi:hypothetical protein
VVIKVTQRGYNYRVMKLMLIHPEYPLKWANEPEWVTSFRTDHTGVSAGQEAISNCRIPRYTQSPRIDPSAFIGTRDLPAGDLLRSPYALKLNVTPGFAIQ